MLLDQNAQGQWDLEKRSEDLTWTWTWHLNVCCGWFTTFSDLVFIRGREINDGREKHCGCNLDEEADVTKQALEELLHLTTAAALARVRPNALQGCYESIQLLWNQQENFSINLREPWITLEMSVHILSSSTSALGLGVLQQDLLNPSAIRWRGCP